MPCSAVALAIGKTLICLDEMRVAGVCTALKDLRRRVGMTKIFQLKYRVMMDCLV
jgi:hypothetical protein